MLADKLSEALGCVETMEEMGLLLLNVIPELENLLKLRPWII
jgi:hypothetical protein